MNSITDLFVLGVVVDQVVVLLLAVIEQDPLRLLLVLKEPQPLERAAAWKNLS
jgi:hypothetical protein